MGSLSVLLERLWSCVKPVPGDSVPTHYVVTYKRLLPSQGLKEPKQNKQKYIYLIDFKISI